MKKCKLRLNIRMFQMKKLLFLLSLLILFPLMSCSTDDNSNFNIDCNSDLVISHWYDENIQVGDYLIVESLEQLNEFVVDIGINSTVLSRYDESHFENNVLILVYIGSGSSSKAYSIKELYLENGVLQTKIIYNKSNDVLCDVVVWNVILEMSKEEVENLVDTNIVIEKIN
jgi:hypothetical protein